VFESGTLTPTFDLSIQNMKSKFENVKVLRTSLDAVRRFKKRNDKNSKGMNTMVIGRFVDHAILEKLEREEKNFQI
jgi:hypothetical protein